MVRFALSFVDATSMANGHSRRLLSRSEMYGEAPAPPATTRVVVRGGKDIRDGSFQRSVRRQCDAVRVNRATRRSPDGRAAVGFVLSSRAERLAQLASPQRRLMV